MHSSEQEIDAEVGHQDGEVGENHEEMVEARFTERRKAFGMESKGIDQEGD